MNLSYDTFNPVYKIADQINTAMAGVYKWMFLAVFVSMGVAFGVGNTPTLVEFFFTGMLKWVVVFAPLIAVIGVSMALNSNPPKEIAQLLLLGFAALMGLSFATIFVIYQLGRIFYRFNFRLD